MSSSPSCVTIEVKLLGVVGCSASGKSTAAHHLARCLNSPLHPITTDHFFLDNVCAQLGTYDDYRCLDYATMSHWMKVLKQPVHHVFTSSVEAGEGEVWQKEALHVWYADLLFRLHEVEAYLPNSVQRGAAVQALDDAPVVNAAGDSEDGGGDDSLCAHEAEDAERRGTSDAIVESTITATNAIPSTHITSGGATLTLYVVWEGFTLLCDAAVNAFLDFAVEVRCDPETACLRRFFRSPRRHLVQHAIQPMRGAAGVENGACDASSRTATAAAAVVACIVRQLYRPRIEQLWAVRAREPQRCALQQDLLQAAQPAVGSHAAYMSCMQVVSDLLAPAAYDPPRPSVMNELLLSSGSASSSSACWDEGGIPTRAFQHFWETEFAAWLDKTAHPAAAAALAWAALDSKDHPTSETHVNGLPLSGKAYVEAVLAERGRLALTANASDGDPQAPRPTVPPAASLSMALAPFYYEFRYWFFFEVLYYDRLVAPLQSFHLRCTSLSCAAAGGAGETEGRMRRWWTLENGRACQGKKEELLLSQARSVALALLTSCNADRQEDSGDGGGVRGASHTSQKGSQNGQRQM